MKTLPVYLSLLLCVSALRADELVAVDALVAEIAGNNPELKFYEAEIAAAKADARAAGARNAPELSVELGRRRVTDTTGTLAGEGNAWAVSVSQSFEWPGRLALRKAVANQDVALAELGLARFQGALKARALGLVFGLAAAEQKALAVREVADRFSALKETFLARDPAGITPLLETRVIEASELVLQRRATEAALEAQKSLVELNQLRGLPMDATQRVAPTKLSFNVAPDIAALLAAARDNNFEYRAKKLELEQQGFAVRLAQNERYPSISVSPYYEQAKAGEKETNYGVGISIPLPLTGRSRAGVDTAKARERQAEVALLLAERELERDVWTAAKAFEAKVAEVQRWSEDSVEKFREAASLADRHYRLGAVPITTYVELQNSYLDAVEALLDTQQEAMDAGLKLQLLAGLDFNPVQPKP
jgi:cobalt-zinc-cadmium efflux system outer membrane protein